MTAYKFVARNELGKRITGKLSANDEIDLQARLKTDNLYLESANEIIKRSSTKRIRSDRVADFARNIGETVELHLFKAQMKLFVKKKEIYMRTF